MTDQIGRKIKIFGLAGKIFFHRISFVEKEMALVKAN